MTTTVTLTDVLANAERWRPFMADVAEAYVKMDEAYDAVARHYGFRCNGCVQNCCRTRFYHHTLAEMCRLLEGYRRLDRRSAEQVLASAGRVADETRRAEASGAAFDQMCPVNSAERCLLYAYRPMICRLHGLPGTMTRPDGAVRTGPGCSAFHLRHGGGADFRLERTEHYARLAGLERRLRQAVGWQGRIKSTVADMICLFDAAGMTPPGRGGP